MTTLTEQTAGLLIAGRAFTPGPPGFVGAAVDLPLAAPGLPDPVVASLVSRPALRHGFLTARSRRVAVVSGPPSPGLAVCLARMADDLSLALPGIASHGVAILGTAASPEPPPGAGIRVGLEAGLDGGGPHGLTRRWTLAHTLAPVLAAAFANAPDAHWRSVRLAARRDLPMVPAGDPRTAWATYVLDAPAAVSGPAAASSPARVSSPPGVNSPPGASSPARVSGPPVAGGPAAPGPSLRALLRDGVRLTTADLDRHLDSLRPPVAARGHLELDVADRQPGDGWRIPVAVATTLLDDPQAALEAEAATAHLAAEPRLWERAARDALTDPALSAAARDCFIAAYAALSRQGADRALRDAVATFTERYVLRGRTPADDLRDHTTAQA